MLANKNPHPRDAQISFQEEGHLYTINGVEGHPISVTTLIHKFFPVFNPDVAISKMTVSRTRPGSPYLGMTDDQIKKTWDDIRTEAARAGTEMHKSIELFLNRPEPEQADVCRYFIMSGGYVHPSAPQTVEFSYFLNYYTQLPGHLVPYRTEWLVYDAEKRLAGSIDLILENRITGNLVIADWKRTKKLEKQNNFSEWGFDFWKHLPNCNFSHYSLQLNIYRHLIEKHYGRRVEKMSIVVLHPNGGDFKEYEIQRMEPEMEGVMRILPLARNVSLSLHKCDDEKEE